MGGNETCSKAKATQYKYGIFQAVVSYSGVSSCLFLFSYLDYAVKNYASVGFYGCHSLAIASMFSTFACSIW